MKVEEKAQTIFDALKGRTFGGVTVVNARILSTTDEKGEPELYLGLVLNDPAGETWPKDDVRDLRRKVVEMSMRGDVRIPLFVRMSPESDAPQADDDAFAL